jgi:hypothetical protein
MKCLVMDKMWCFLMFHGISTVFILSVLKETLTCTELDTVSEGFACEKLKLLTFMLGCEKLVYHI